MQHNEESSIEDGPQMMDDASSMDELEEPQQKLKLQKRIFETTNVKVKSGKDMALDSLVTCGASLSNSQIATNNFEGVDYHLSQS